ncbi:hypothetical protein ZYGR_0P03270 [Zygosaccharomyces rouxii]|uniref:Signal recognition particle subunit SRP68 n=2 Tax=Zygosaccharomyces rouxii TaxID=4956 RepID=C5E4R0_ZYGRC|nr:uncharacterized protein ZYRO0E08074g [Zygosaccharomyces rouxii]KAH9198123.1 hypothetical protein LQ764DRAFT_146629 [Zygosaccharomyces rouxii]GAV49681.1 hypothetical protein ZYGR_0P03270 [Zygosaccharomyces rouxii]CAR31021.1 ZYRO0E08074p [Zygosaccharomyces rouxii]
MGVYSPLLATYGVRVDQLLETVQDFVRYHDKLNKKLQKLRHRCQLTTRDTKKYRTKEKYSKLSSDDYDENSKLYGVVVLLHAERDLALAEVLKLRARQRGKMKKSERKVVSTRLKRAMQTSEKLVALTTNESQWITRVQYLVYEKLARAEYLTHGKQQRHKDSKKISKELALSFAALKYLEQASVITDSVVEFLHAKYEYTLKQHADGAFSSTELHNFVVEKVEEASQNGDEMVKLLVENGYKPQKQASEAGTSFKEIQWRAFTAKVYDPQVEELIAESKSVTVKSAPDYDTKLLKWQQALEIQESRIASQDEDEEDEADNQENDQILLAYIKYNALFTSVLRDNYLFGQLWQQWTKLGTAMASRLTKSKEIERIVKNLQKYLQDIMELPGVYRDDELTEQLELSKLYFQLTYTSGCLGGLYQLKGRYLESLALHVDAHQKLEERLTEMGNFQDILIPLEVLSHKKIESLQQLIKAGWKSVVSLAEYEKHLKVQGQAAHQPTLIEKLDTGRIIPSDVKLSNIFPLRPKLRPVPSKPTLFDLAFNYMDYAGEGSESASSWTTQRSEPAPASNNGDDNNSNTNKKRGFLGLFGR